MSCGWKTVKLTFNRTCCCETTVIFSTSPSDCFMCISDGTVNPFSSFFVWKFFACTDPKFGRIWEQIANAAGRTVKITQDYPTPRQNALRMSRARTFGCSSVSPPAYLKHYWNIGKNQNISVSGCLNLKTQVSKAELISNTPYTNKAFNFVSVDFCTTHLQLCTKGENNARSEKFARA